MHNFCFAVTSCFLFRLQLALFNTSFRHVICAHTPRRAMLQERSERCSHKEEKKSLTLGCFYRLPDFKICTSEELVKSLDLMPKNSNQTIVLGGDFNLPGID